MNWVGCHKTEEMLIVLFTDAVVEPVTMVVEFRDTFVATSAVLGLWSNLRLANHTVKHVHLVRIILLIHLDAIFHKGIHAINLLSFESVIDYKKACENMTSNYWIIVCCLRVTLVLLKRSKIKENWLSREEFDPHYNLLVVQRSLEAILSHLTNRFKRLIHFLFINLTIFDTFNHVDCSKRMLETF